ncbi:MAG: hypothetical protein DMG26_05370 [Acidobacteria bacterium]|nr:MAG: hypothetical protein DMG26_05370 [Acidobacteriota bacterium]
MTSPTTRTTASSISGPPTELAADVAQGTVAHYNFVAPDICHDMHTSCAGGDPIQEGDTWLSANVPTIMGSAAYRAGVLFITWDEGLVRGNPPTVPGGCSCCYHLASVATRTRFATIMGRCCAPWRKPSE